MALRIASIVVLGFLAYGCMLHAPFKSMDDRTSIVQNPTIKSWSNVSKVFRQGYFHDDHYYRPLANLTYLVEYQLVGLKPFFYNLDNLTLHILNALLVFWLLSQLVDGTVGFWTGLLFVIHPVQWEAVCNIAGRSILLSAFFVLSAFNLFLCFYRTRRWLWLALSLAAFFLGLLSKESAGVLPAVVLAFLWFDQSKPWKEKISGWWLFLVVVAVYMSLRGCFGITKLYAPQDFYVAYLGFATFLRSLITDLRLLIWPVDLHFDRSLAYLKPVAAAIVLAFWFLAGTLVFAERHRVPRLMVFLVAWFAIELLPVSQLVTAIGVGTGHISTAEHFLYVAAAPLLAIVVLVFRWLRGVNQYRRWVRPGVLKFFAAGVITFWFLTAVEQSLYASNELRMLQRSLSYEPDNGRVQEAMGLCYVFHGDLADADHHFRAAIKVEPLDAKYHISLATTLCREHQWVECLGQYIVLDPGDDKALVDKAVPMAMKHIQAQINQGKPFDAREWNILGIYYGQKGQVDKATAAFNKSIALDSAQKDVWMNLYSLYQAQSDRLDAQQALARLKHWTEPKP